MLHFLIKKLKKKTRQQKFQGIGEKKNSVYQPGGREVEIRPIKIFRRVGEQIRFVKKYFIISGVATAERIRRIHDLKISHIQIINT